MILEREREKMHSCNFKRVYSFKIENNVFLGKGNMLWPGLNAPIMKGKDVVKIQKLAPNPQYQEQLVKLRDDLSRVKYPKLAPLERGWTGNRFPGQSIGPPEPFGDCKF